MRSEVMWFANQMEKKLRQTGYKGDRDAWLNSTAEYLLDRLLDEAKELVIAVREEERIRRGRVGLDAVIDECVDVANFSMMLADRVRYLRALEGVE